MPLENNLNNPARHQRIPSVDINVPVYSSINQMPAEEIQAFSSNIVNAIVAHSQSKSVVKKNFQDLQRLSSLDKQIRFKVSDQELKLRVKAPEVSADLPVFFRKDIKDTIDLSAPLPATLQKPGECTTILDLLKASFPQLTSSPFFNKETKIPRFVFSSPIPLNHENKGNFFPQIASEGQIAYIAWDASASQIAKGFKEETCDILLKNEEAFCGVALSQANLKGIEKGAGVSAHFMTSRVTVIGILVTKPPARTQSYWLDGGRVGYDGPRLSRGVVSDSSFAEYPEGRLISRGSSKGEMTSFGMLGVQGATVSNVKGNLSDRGKREGEKLIPFCLEIVPQFSSEENPVREDDLVMAIEALIQEKIFAQFKKLNFR
ncbi:MAG TPA: hypothetical protein VGZ69_05215 [Candidatus Rhabdochlamydia sp.]|jgi:hypothetical protein|nr:hypothetical protein [Candidatus Rhabdochlamydia sp.]